MANIQPEIKKIQTATYGEEVRNSFISALEKINSSAGSASIDDIRDFVNEYLDSHPQDLTLAAYAHETHSSGYDTDTNPVDIYSDGGVYIDEALDPSTIYIIKNSGGAHIGILLCAHTNGYNRAAQIALYADGRFKYRYRHNSDGVWDNWESLLPFDAVVRNYKDATPDVTFNMHNTKVDAFLQTEAYDSSDYSYSNLPTADSTNWDRPNTTTITIPSGSSKIVFYDTVTRAERVESTSGTTHTVDNLIPNRNYAYTVRNSSGEMLMHGIIKATGQLRMINAGGDDTEVDRTFNIRDLGGWTATGGKLKYGLVYRGGELNGSISISSAQQAFFKDVLGIRHEIDLRDNGEPGVGATALGCGVNYYHLATGRSPYVLGDNDTYAKKRADVIKQLAKNIKNGEPTYIHCSAGADRTGVMCVFLKAICGVSQSDIDRDQELSYYSYQADAQRVRKRNNMWANGHRVMINGTGAEDYSQPYINNMEGSSFQDKIIRLLLRSGVTIDELNDIRFGLIDGNPTALTNPYGNATITKNLSHVFIDNKDTSVKLYQPFEARVLPNDGYILTSVSVTMGGTDITSTAYNAERILIPRVTGDIIITASATDMAEILKKRMASTKDYGFVGDGTAEDTARLQRAIDENSVLYIPKKSDNKPYYLYTPDPNTNDQTVTYPTHDCITISHPIVIFGDGMAKTILMIKHQDRDDDYKNNIGGAVIKINNGNKVVIRDLAIYGIKGTGNPPGKKDGIVIDNSNAVVIENVEFKQLNNDGIRILSYCNGSFFNNLHITECGRNGLFQAGHGNCFSNIYAHHNYNGLFLEEGGGQVTNVRTGENKGNGMVLHRAVAFLINNVESQQNKLNGLLMLNDYYGSTYASQYGRVWPCRGNIISNFQCFGNNYRASNSEANAGASGFVIAGVDNVIHGNDIPCRNMVTLSGTWMAFEQSSVKISSPYTTNNIIDITQSFGFDGDRYDLELNADNNFNEFKSVDSVVPLEVNEIKINGNRVTENDFKSSTYSSRAVSTYYSSRPGVFGGVQSTVSANTLTISQGASGYIDSNNVYQKLLRNLDQIRTNSSGIETAITRRTSRIVDGEVEYTAHEGILVMPLFRMANSTKVAPFSTNTYYCDDSENEHVPAGAARIFLKLKYRVTPNNPSAYGKWGIYTIVQAVINGADPEQLNPYVSEVKSTCCYSGEYLERYFVYDFSHLAANENISIDHIAVNLCFAKLASGDDIASEPDAVGFEMPEIKFAYGSGSLTQLEAASGVTAPSFVYP